jgi:uncharacterized membrane protein YgcG
VFPVAELSSSGVRLVPLIPSLHAKPLYERLSQDPLTDTYQYLTASQPKSLSHFLTKLEASKHLAEDAVLFVIFDTTDGSEMLAGYTG